MLVITLGFGEKHRRAINRSGALVGLCGVYLAIAHDVLYARHHRQRIFSELLHYRAHRSEE